MSRFTYRTFLVVLAALLGAALAFTASPANASQSSCSGYDLYVLNPLTDTTLVAVDLNGDNIVCVGTDGTDVATVGDNSSLAALLPAGLANGFTLVDGAVTIEGSEITIHHILSTDQRGNRNSLVTAGACQNNNGNSCFSNNKFLQNIRVVVADDVLGL